MMKKSIPSSIYQKIGEILIIFTKAVRKAQEENRKLGLPNVYCEREEIFYQLPDGRITREIPVNLLNF